MEAIMVDVFNYLLLSKSSNCGCFVTILHLSIWKPFCFMYSTIYLLLGNSCTICCCFVILWHVTGRLPCVIM